MESTEKWIACVASAVWRPRKYSATTPPPPVNRVDSGRSGENSATTLPPLNRVSTLGDHGKILLLPSPPPPLNRVDDLALHTKGAAPLGKSWICDWFVTYPDARWHISSIVDSSSQAHILLASTHVAPMLLCGPDQFQRAAAQYYSALGHYGTVVNNLSRHNLIMPGGHHQLTTPYNSTQLYLVFSWWCPRSVRLATKN